MNQPSLSDVANVPFEYEIGGRTLKLAQLSIGRLFALTEQRIRDRYVSDARVLCESMEPTERAEFMHAALRTMPNGEDLTEKVQAELESFSGVVDVLVLSTEQAGDPVDRDTIIELIDERTTEELGVIIEKVCGMVSTDEPVEGSDSKN